MVWAESNVGLKISELMCTNKIKKKIGYPETKYTW